MRKFEISDKFTTSDIGLELQADDLAGLFQAGAEGMFTIILGARRPDAESSRRSFDLRADTAEQLLVDWLSELLYGFDTDGLIPVEYSVTVREDRDGTAIESKIGFGLFDPANDEAEHEIKAVTYYKLNIYKDGNTYRCHVVFDL